jgi:hypothetical protein
MIYTCNMVPTNMLMNSTSDNRTIDRLVKNIGPLSNPDNLESVTELPIVSRIVPRVSGQLL